MKKTILHILLVVFSIMACSEAGSVDKQIDEKIRLHDIWALENIEGNKLILGDGQKRPQLEIYIQEMRIQGNDGCNNISGGIKNVDSENIKFGPIRATRKLCVHMDIPHMFHQHINMVHTYVLKTLELYLYDNDGNELLKFKKID